MPLILSDGPISLLFSYKKLTTRLGKSSRMGPMGMMKARLALIASLCCSTGIGAELSLSELAKQVKNGQVALAIRDGTRAEGLLRSIDLTTGELTIKGRKAPIACASIAHVTFESAVRGNARALVFMTSTLGLAITGGMATQRRLMSNKAQGAAMAAGAVSGVVVGIVAVPKRTKTVALVCPSP